MFGTEIKIGDKKYTLKYTVNIICEMDANGFNIMDMEEQEMSVTVLRQLFYYGLKKYHRKEVTSEEVAGDLMSDYLEEEGNSFTQLSDLLNKALFSSLGIKDEDAQKAIEEAQKEGKLTKTRHKASEK